MLLSPPPPPCRWLDSARSLYEQDVETNSHMYLRFKYYSIMDLDMRVSESAVGGGGGVVWCGVVWCGVVCTYVVCECILFNVHLMLLTLLCISTHLHSSNVTCGGLTSRAVAACSFMNHILSSHGH